MFEIRALDKGRVTPIVVEKIMTADAVVKGRVGSRAER